MRELSEIMSECWLAHPKSRLTAYKVCFMRKQEKNAACTRELNLQVKKELGRLVQIAVSGREQKIDL